MNYGGRRIEILLRDDEAWVAYHDAGKRFPMLTEHKTCAAAMRGR